MSGEEPDRPPDAPQDEEGPELPVETGPLLPYSWLTMVLGFVALLAAAILCGVFLARFMSIRPVNLRPETDALADAVEELLLNNLIPPEQIRREPGGQVADDSDRAVWHFCTLEVEVPESLSLDGVVDLIRRNMLRRDVTVSSIAQGDAQREMGLYLGAYRFATVLLKAPGPALPQRRDLRASCKAVADDVEALLRDVGVEPGGLTRAEPMAKESFEALWTFTRMEAILPASATAEDVAGRITAALANGDVRVTSHSEQDGRMTLGVSCAGKACLELALVPPPATAWYDNLPPIQLPTLAQAIRNLDLNEILSIALPGPDEIELESSGLDETELKRALPSATSADTARKRVAIIVDDGGYGGPITEAILGLDPGLTLAILPNTPHATDTAQRAAELGFEIMLHMPMEKAKFPGRISTDMTDKQIRELTENALGQIPGAVGVNNHAGSKFTADEKAMARFLESIKEKSLFFVDSRTTAETKAWEVANRMGIRAASRDVFLDNEEAAGYIRAQFDHLVEVANQQGEAVAICHFRANTAKVLSEVLPELQGNGIELVHVSELVQ